MSAYSLSDPAPVFFQAPNLAAQAGIRHAFFTRNGGVSEGIYKSLNCGLGSRDDQACIRQNRAFVAGTMNVAADKLVTVHQAHTINCVIVDAPFTGDAPHADALVTKKPGLAIAIASADCTPILFADPKARVLGATHAGWRGALKGIVGTTIEQMTSLGADPANMYAAIGPTIAQKSFEVGSDVIDACVAMDASHEQYFQKTGEGKALFNLPAFVTGELRRAGVHNIEDLGRDTYAEEDLFYSYRRMTHKGEPDYGRHLHAIVLEG